MTGPAKPGKAEGPAAGRMGPGWAGSSDRSLEGKMKGRGQDRTKGPRTSPRCQRSRPPSP